jgi:hypothetical protein
MVQEQKDGGPQAAKAAARRSTEETP